MQPKDFDLLRPSAKARLILAVVGGVLLAWLLVSRKPWTISVPDSGAWRLSDYVAVYVWIAALINLVLVTLLALTAHWWTRPLLNVRLSSAPEPGRYPSRCESLGERSEGLCLRPLPDSARNFLPFVRCQERTLAVVGGIWNRSVLSNVFLSHVRLRNDTPQTR
jgi:hypothetical protein